MEARSRNLCEAGERGGGAGDIGGGAGERGENESHDDEEEEDSDGSGGLSRRTSQRRCLEGLMVLYLGKRP